jgi:hypothetical protein
MQSCEQIDIARGRRSSSSNNINDINNNNHNNKFFNNKKHNNISESRTHKYNNNSGDKATGQPKRCIYHPDSTTHNTAECRSKRSAEPKLPSPFKPAPTFKPTNTPAKRERNDRPPIKCYGCGGPHLITACPTRSTPTKAGTPQKASVRALLQQALGVINDSSSSADSSSTPRHHKRAKNSGGNNTVKQESH